MLDEALAGADALAVDLQNAERGLSVEALRRMGPADALAAMKSSEQGLAPEEVETRLARYGDNSTPRIKKRVALTLLAQFTHVMALLLWAGGLGAFLAGMPELGLAICLVNLINGAFAFWQEHRAERATEALLELIPRKARVRRGGVELEVPAASLVPGDLLVLAEGDRISADALLLEASSLQVTEAELTGESEPVAKNALPAPDVAMRFPHQVGDGNACDVIVSLGPAPALRGPSLPFRPDDTASLSAGTAVLRGAGLALVVATGGNTRFGAIARSTLGVDKSASPLQKELSTATRRITAIAVGTGVVFFLLSLLVAQMSVGQAIVFSLGMIVAFVPEGLLPTVTLALALSTQRMARRQALVRRLSAVETLGATSVICTDKTGTLTQNQMTLVEARTSTGALRFEGTGYTPTGTVWLEDRRVNTPDPVVRSLFTTLTACNDARLVHDQDGAHVLGDPTEGAMLVAASRLGLSSEPPPRLADLPFDSFVRRMSTLHLEGDRVVLNAKGAPSEILARCTTELTPDGERPLDEARRLAIRADANALASRSLRVLFAASRVLPEDLAAKARAHHQNHEHQELDREDLERDLVFVGVVGLHDPPRPEVHGAIARCHAAGIRVVMLTGDHPLAAEYIARELGLVSGPELRVCTGADLEAMDDEALIAELAREVVFARTSPAQKLRIVAALQAHGHVVAVTGDGVNDAPALRKADIGVAMGRSGTDVARETADMVLLDDDFASIVAAVEEGRTVYANIKKFTSYIFTSNVPEALPFILFALSGGEIPLALAVMHILAIDLGTDIFPALALAGEPPERDTMSRPPRRPGDHIITRRLVARAYLLLGPVQALAVMLAFFGHYWLAGYEGVMGLPGDGAVYRQATTMALAAVVMTQIGNLFAHRTELLPAMRAGHNRLLLMGLLAELALLLLFIYVEPVARLIGLEPFPAEQWLLLVGLVPLLFLVDEARKWLARRRWATAHGQVETGASR